jgi:hypothetical protein
VAGLNSDFLDLLDAFLKQDVRFLIVGAHAVGAHGAPRATGDMDVWVQPERANAERVWAALDKFGAPLLDHGLTLEDLHREGTVYQMGLPPFRIDVLTAISGCSFEEAWAGRLEQSLDGRPIPFLGLEDLLRNKRAAGRTKDLLDIELLREAGVDVG